MREGGESTAINLGEDVKLYKVVTLALALVLPIWGAAIGKPLLPAGTSTNWASHGGGVDESGYSQLTQITPANVGKLGLQSYLDLDNEVTLEATPLAVNGTLYFTGSTGSIYAVNAVSGKLLWKYDPEIWKYSPVKQRDNFGSNRGVAYASGRIFAGVLDGRLIALDARTGKLLWSVDTVPPEDIHTVNGAPRVFNGKVIIGNGGADADMRGYVTAYDQKTGKQSWRFYVTPGSPEENKGNPALEAAAKTWGNGQYWKSGTGGTVWNGITFDPEFNRIYLGTGNAGPYNPRVRDPNGGDDLYICSVVALDANTGKYLWHYQYNPREGWDYKATTNMIETTITIDGKPRKVLMQAPTNGFFYVIDRETGKLISAEKTGKVTWADHIDLATGRPVEAKNIRYETGETIIYPSFQGAHNWQDMAYNPKTGLVYIPYMKLGGRYTTTINPGDLPMGGVTVHPYLHDPDDGKGALIAWDPVQQKLRWKVQHDFMWNGGPVTTAGGLVFQGTADGYFSAYDATTGALLWKFNVGHGIISNPISYSVKGKQYVSVLAGYGGSAAALSQIMDVGWKFGATRRILTFSLDGKQVLPPAPPRDMTVHAVDVPSLKIDEAAVMQGKMLQIACFACHGQNFHGAGAPGPDLRESQAALSEATMYSIVHDGALMQLGMPRFEMLNQSQIHALYMYIRARAREALGKRVAIEDLPPKPTAAFYSSAKTDIGTILDTPAVAAVVNKHIPGFTQRSQISLARSMTLKAIQAYDATITDAILAKTDADLAKLPPPKAH
jgi:quinohemoprotein ethanol dehydrogenase